MYTHCIEYKQQFSRANVFTKDGARETQISGLCEKCFDTICAEPEEPPSDADEPAF